MKNQIAKITGNPIGALAGAVIIYFVAKKYAGSFVSNKLALVAVLVVGTIAGAHAQAKIAARQGAAKSAAVVK